MTAMDSDIRSLLFNGILGIGTFVAVAIVLSLLVAWVRHKPSAKRTNGSPGPRPDLRVSKDLENGKYFLRIRRGLKLLPLLHDGKGSVFTSLERDGDVLYFGQHESATAFLERLLGDWKKANHAWRAKRGKVRAVHGMKVFK